MQYVGAAAKSTCWLTDVMVPNGMNGQEPAEWLKARHSELKVLFISGYIDEVIVRHSALEPRLFLLQKPLAPNIPLGKVHQVLDV